MAGKPEPRRPGGPWDKPWNAIRRKWSLEDRDINKAAWKSLRAGKQVEWKDQKVDAKNVKVVRYGGEASKFPDKEGVLARHAERTKDDNVFEKIMRALNGQTSFGEQLGFEQEAMENSKFAKSFKIEQKIPKATGERGGGKRREEQPGREQRDKERPTKQPKLERKKTLPKWDRQ